MKEIVGLSGKSPRTVNHDIRNNDINFLLTESEVVPGKSQTENRATARSIRRFSCEDLTFEVNKMFTVCLLFLQVRNRRVGITGEQCPKISQSERTLHSLLTQTT